MSVTKQLPFEEYKAIYSKVPRLTVEVILLSEKGICLTFREINPYKDEWHFPGGTVLFGETLEMALKRVAEEELGIQIKIKKQLGYIEYPNEKKKGGFTQTVGIAFLVEALSGEYRGSDQGHKIEFFKELPENLIEEQKECLEKWLSGYFKN